MHVLKQKCLAWLLVLLLVASSAVSGAFAADSSADLSKKGSVTVQLLSSAEGHAPIAGAGLSLYKVATVTSSGGQLVYTYTEDFAGCGHGLEDLNAELLPEQLVAWADEQAREPLAKLQTDKQGEAVYGALDMALYLVRQSGQLSGYRAMELFLVALPMTNAAGTGWDYEVVAKPKLEPAPPGPGPNPTPPPTPTPDPDTPDPPKPPAEKRLRVEKVWSDSASTHKPVEARLYRDNGVLVDVVTLSEKNHWQYEWTELAAESRWYVLELEVPADYTVRYERLSETLIRATNTRENDDKKPPADGQKPSPGGGGLIQTGQLHWPVPVLAIAGMVLFGAGWILRKRDEK